MDRDQAKFILSSFRPDGADADSPEFTEALHLAIADRELGDWLAKERADDAVFAGALAKLNLPEDLREGILAAMAAERGHEPPRDDQDLAFAEALSVIRPPAGLREEVLMAMQQSVPRKSGWQWAVPFAAAAGIMLALNLSRDEPVLPTVPVVSGAVPVSHVEAAAIQALTSPEFSLERKSADHEELFRFIRASNRACPAGCIPKGLQKVPGLGCRTIEVDGKPGAIVCFLRGENDVVHLVVFRREDVEVSSGDGAGPELEQHGEWAVAKWTEKGRTFLLLGHSGVKELGELF